MSTDVNQIDGWKEVVISRLDSHDLLIKQIERQQIADGIDIKNLKEDIKEIKDDTKWTRRAITNACIVAVIGGVIGLFFFLLQLNWGGN